MEQTLSQVEHKAVKSILSMGAPLSVGEFKLLLKAVGLKTLEELAIARLAADAGRIASSVTLAELADISHLLWEANLKVSREKRDVFQKAVQAPAEAEGLRRTIVALQKGGVDSSTRHTWVAQAFAAVGKVTYEEEFPEGSLFRGCEEKSYSYTTPSGVTLDYTSRLRGCDRREKTVTVGESVLWDGSYTF